MIPLLNQNTVEVRNQITLLTLYYIRCGLVTLLKIKDAPIQVSNIFYLTVSFKYINFRCPIFLLCIPEMSTSFASSLFRLSTLLWFWFYNHCILACILLSTNREHCSSNHGWRFFNSYRPSLFLSEVLKFSLLFSQDLL
jgi:hypothetical protein